MSETKIIVLDDDPTGSQTVHGCLLLTRWDKDTLREAIMDASPLFFVLTNTRGMAAKPAADITREVCQNLKLALAELKQERTRHQPDPGQPFGFDAARPLPGGDRCDRRGAGPVRRALPGAGIF